ncbi:MAG: transcription antitermination factor NusB [Bacillota bacterium]|jgi:N utilization substance protein B
MSRNKARETALQMSFQLDVGKNDWTMAQATLNESGISAENQEFVLSLVQGTLRHLQKIDQLINKYSNQWQVDRLANVDRSILRMAVYELHFLSGSEPKIAINEAIELAKKYSTEESGAFVNAILDSINKDGQAE